MITTIKDPEIALLEAAFYEKHFNFSFSSLYMLMTVPKIFYKNYILADKDDEFKKYFLNGKIIHYLLLENASFDEHFIVATNYLPSENSVNIIERIFKECYTSEDPDPAKSLLDFQNEILDILKELNLHQGLTDTKDGTGDSKRIAKVADARGLDYFEFLKNKGTRTIIDTALLDECAKRADILKANSAIRALLGMDLVSDGRRFGVYNELHITIPAEELGLPFGLHGFLDNMVVDVVAKHIRINDFKTTGKELASFTDSLEMFWYWLQAAVYVKLAKYYLRTVITADWTISFNFVVFDKYNQVYPFPVCDATLQEWDKQADEVLNKALYHYEAKDYTLPYDYAMKNITL
jgi:hypothetical protein